MFSSSRGLLASTIAARQSQNSVFPTLSFLISKLAAYTVLGFILGAFGGTLNISPNVQTAMQFIAGVYMIVIALNLLNVHPIFRYGVIQPPRFLARIVRNQSKSENLFAPAFLGAMTIFIPCGTTLAMEALAISSANPFQGAVIMFVFILGTAPLFFGVGWLTSILGDNFKTKFLKIAGLTVIFLGITSVNGALIAAGSPISLPTIELNLNSSQESQKSINTKTSQNPVINITSNGYSPRNILVNKDQPVTLTLKTSNTFSCASAFRIPSLEISKDLQPNDTQTIVFTPTQVGKIPFTCSMGMYTGVFEVI